MHGGFFFTTEHCYRGFGKLSDLAAMSDLLIFMIGAKCSVSTKCVPTERSIQSPKSLQTVKSLVNNE